MGEHEPVPFKRPRRSTIGCETAPERQLNLNVRGLAPSATVAINERSDALRRAGRTIFKLGLGQSPFPVPEPVVQALRDHAHEKDYLPVQGLPALRDAVSDQHSTLHDIETTGQDVLVGPGSKELMFILQLVYYGDLVVPTPAWVSYAPQAQIIGRHVRLLATHAENGWRVTPQQLDALCRSDPTRPRIVVLNYPSNPTGTTFSPDELGELAEVARRYRLIVLSDEIYGRLHHDRAHDSIVPLYPEGTIWSGGLSKWCGAGGWRLGVFVFPECLGWLREAMSAVASETYTSTSAPIQHAAVRAFQSNDPEIDAYLEGCCRVLKALGQRLADRIEETGLKVHHPQGGFYLFPYFGTKAERLLERGIFTSADLCERLLADTGVAILPGADFGRPPEELSARLAYVNFDGARALAAARELGEGAAIDAEFLKRHCGETLEAVDRLCDWVDG